MKQLDTVTNDLFVPQRILCRVGDPAEIFWLRTSYVLKVLQRASHGLSSKRTKFEADYATDHQSRTSDSVAALILPHAGALPSRRLLLRS